MATVIGEFVAKIGADMGGFEKGVDSADKQMGSLASNFAKHRKAIGIGMTAMGGAILGGLGMMVKGAAEFEAGMREVNTMMGLGQEEFQAFSKDVLKLSKDMGINAVESTAALYQAISAGVPKENVLTFMEVASKAAIGGITSTETAVDGLTTVINAFKIPVEDSKKAADIMFATVKAGKTTFEELSASMFNVAPIAAATGIGFDEVSAAIATMTKQGFPTAQATTSIRQAIVALQKPTKEMGEMIRSLGYATGEAMIAELGFGKTLDTLRSATGGSNEMLMKMFGSVEAGGAVLAMTGANAASFTADLDAMRAATDGVGASTAAFNEVELGASRQLEKAKESIKAVAIEIGGTLLPQLTPLIEKVGVVVGKISAWMEKNPELVGTIVKIVAVIGGLLTVLGPLMLILPGLTAALPLLGAAFTLMLGPVGLIIAAIAGLIAIGVLVYKNWDHIKEGAINAWGAILRFVEGAVNGIIDIINSMIRVINKIPFVNIGEIGKVGFAPQKMHGGGVVPGRPGQEVPIIAEAGEVIKPAGAGGGATIVVNVAGSVISERDIGEIVREQLYQIENRNYSLNFT